MKKLYIVRHAKSDWSQPGQSDADRVLLEKGIRRTKLVLSYLIQRDVKPDRILTSHAARAFETARLIAGGLGIDEDSVITDKSIYHSDEDDLLTLIESVPDDIQSLMIVGHNPTLTNLANYFLDAPLEWLPTSGVIGIELNTVHWAEAGKAARNLHFIMFPKMLK
jgi:phosphohistidine phosphatase